MSIPDFKIPLTQVLKPLQELGVFLTDRAPLVIDSAHITVPTITVADVGGSAQNTNSTTGNFSVFAFKNAAADQVYIGAQHLGSSSTSGADFLIATKTPGTSTFAERLRVGNPSGTVGIDYVPAKTTLSSQLHQAENHFFFEADGGLINRLGGKLFVGAAIQNTAGSRDWSEAIRMGTGGTFAGVVNTSGSTVSWVSGDLFVTAVSVFAVANGVEPLKGQTILIDRTSGALVIGTRYTISAYVAGDNFTNVGALSNATGISFVATGTTPTTYSNGSTLTSYHSVTAVASDTSITVSPAPGTLSNKAYRFGQGMIQSGSTAVVSILTDPLNSSSQNALYLGASSAGASGDGWAGYAQANVFVNNSLFNAVGWVRYDEGHRMNDLVGYTVGNEIEMVNRGAAVYTDPQRGFDAKQVQALQLGSGAGLSYIGQTNPTTALLIFNNAQGGGSIAWNAGIMFTKDSIAASGPGGTKSAIQFATDHQAQWFGAPAVGGDPGVLAGAISVDSFNRMQLTALNGVEVRAVSAVVNSFRSHFSLISTDSQAIDKGPQMQFVGYNGSGGGSDPQAFATIAGRKENGTSSNWAGYLQFSTTNAAGTIAEAARFTSSKVFVIKNGTIPSLDSTVVQMGAYNVTASGTDIPSEALGSQFYMKSKGANFFCHASFGVDALVDQQIGGGTVRAIVSIKEILGTVASPQNFSTVDPTTGLTIAKRDGLHSWLQTCSSGDVGETNEVTGIRSLVTDTSTGNHTGKFYAGSHEMDSAGTGRHARIRGGYALLAKGGSGTWGDGKAFLALFQNYTGSSGLMDLVDVGAFEWNLGVSADFTQANGIRTRLSVSSPTPGATVVTCPDFRNIRVSAPVLTGGPTLVIPKFAGVSIADLSGITGVATDYNFHSEGINAFNVLESGLTVGGPQLITDAATAAGVLQGQSAWGGASTNTTGGNLILAGGPGARRFTSLLNNAGAVTVTIVVNGTSVSLASTTNFILGSDNTAPQLAVTATNLAAAINANGTLNTKIFAVASAAVVIIKKRPSCYTLTIATNQALRISTASGADGNVAIFSNVGIGTASPGSKLDVNGSTSTASTTGFELIHTQGADAINSQPLVADAYGATSANVIIGRTAGGTATTPSATPSGAFLLGLSGRGWDTAWESAAKVLIGLKAAETHAAGANGTFITFETTSIGSTTRAEKMRITDAGNVGIGTTTPAPSALLDLTSTTKALLVPRMTTTEKNALTAVNGMILYDATLNKFQGYENGAWTSFI